MVLTVLKKTAILLLLVLYNCLSLYYRLLGCRPPGLPGARLGAGEDLERPLRAVHKVIRIKYLDSMSSR